MIETPFPTLSRGVKRLNEIYANEFNCRHHRVGHLFQGRFKGIFVERESHLLELVRYLVLNPVRAGMVRYAGAYRWSNDRATAGLAPAPPWLEAAWTLDQFPGRSVQSSQERSRRFVASGRNANYNPWEQVIGQIFLGGEVFCERMQTLIDSKPRGRAHPKAQCRVVLASFDAIIDCVTDCFDETVDSLRSRSHRPARKAIAQLAWQEAGLTLSTIGEWLGLTEPSVNDRIKRGKQLKQSHDEYASRLRRIRLRLGVDKAPF